MEVELLDSRAHGSLGVQQSQRVARYALKAIACCPLLAWGAIMCSSSGVVLNDCLLLQNEVKLVRRRRLPYQKPSPDDPNKGDVVHSMVSTSKGMKFCLANDIASMWRREKE